LDLGTSTGVAYAWFDPGNPIDYDVFLFKLALLNPTCEYETRVCGPVRLINMLEEMQPDVVFMEDVKYKPGSIPVGHMRIRAMFNQVASTGEFFGALKMTVTAWCERNAVPCFGFNIMEIKRRATGGGIADKEKVVRAYNEWVGHKVLEPEKCENSGHDDLADAGWVLNLGIESYGKGVLKEEDEPFIPNIGDDWEEAQKAYAAEQARKAEIERLVHEALSKVEYTSPAGIISEQFLEGFEKACKELDGRKGA
jgi:Holliday junction resolvasome RuvABC endonuclease subunit